jgi:LuxR family transcriptional activator of bioluminescence operon
MSLNEIEKHWDNYLMSFGIIMYSITYYHYHPKAKHEKHKLRYEFCSKSYLPWHDHYLVEGYNDADSTLQASYQAPLPSYWNLEEQLKNAATQRERDMRLDSIRFGAELGLSIPVHGPENDFANFVFVQMKNQDCLKNWRDLRFELFVASQYYFHHLRRLLLKEIKKDKNAILSSRELQCLTLTARRYSVEKISKELFISERTVNFHLQNINKKLGTSNKHESVNKAIQLGLLAV